MGRKKKEFNKDGIFQIRFRSLCYESGKTQEQLAQTLGVSRPTVSGWLDGKNIPDIISLTQIAEHFHVSADYLLGLSKTVSPDVSLRAAVEYTGLSEEAVNWCHTGFDYTNPFGTRLSEKEKRENLHTVSDLICSGEFRDMIDYLVDYTETADLASIAESATEQYWDYLRPDATDKFRFTGPEDRRKVIEAIQCAYQKGRIFHEESVAEKLEEMDDEDLTKYLESARDDIRDEVDLRQFLITKKISSYVDGIMRKSRRQAFRDTKR